MFSMICQWRAPKTERPRRIEGGTPRTIREATFSSMGRATLGKRRSFWDACLAFNAGPAMEKICPITVLSQFVTVFSKLLELVL